LIIFRLKELKFVQPHWIACARTVAELRKRASSISRMRALLRGGCVTIQLGAAVPIVKASNIQLLMHFSVANRSLHNHTNHSFAGAEGERFTD